MILFFKIPKNLKPLGAHCSIICNLFYEKFNNKQSDDGFEFQKVKPKENYIELNLNDKQQVDAFEFPKLPSGTKFFDFNINTKQQDDEFTFTTPKPTEEYSYP